MFPVWNAVKTFPNERKQIASYIPDENASSTSSRSRTARSAGVACGAARSTVRSIVTLAGICSS